MRKVICFFVFMLITCFASSVFAAPEPGAMRGKLPGAGTNNAGQGMQETKITDGDDITGVNMSTSNRLVYHLDRPSTVTGYYFCGKGTGTDANTGAYNTRLALIDANDKYLATYSLRDNANCGNSYQKLSTPVQKVSKVYVESTGGTSIVYGADIQIIKDWPPNDVSSLLTKTISKSSIKLSWQDPPDSDLAEVRIYRGDTQVAAIPKGVKEFTDTGLTPATDYAYRVTTVDTTGNESKGLPTVGRTRDAVVPPPDEVTDIKTTVYNDRIKMTWTNPSDVFLLQVVIYKDGKPVAYVNTPATSFTDYDLDEHATYTYLFRSVDTDGNMSPGVSITETTKGKPSVIKGLYGQAGDGKATLFFGKSLDPELIAYKIYQDGQQIATITDNTYEVKGLENGTTYRFSVTAYNQWGESQRAQEIALTPQPPPPPSNVTIQAKNVGHNDVSLAFTATDAESIKVYRNNQLVETLPGTATEYVDTGLQADTSYSYYIRAENAFGAAASQIIRVQTKTTGQVLNLRTTERKTNRLAFSWDRDPTAEKYVVDVTIKHKLTASIDWMAGPDPVTTKTIETTETQVEVTDLMPEDEVTVAVSIVNAVLGKHGTASVTQTVPVVDVPEDFGENDFFSPLDLFHSALSLGKNFWPFLILGLCFVIVPWIYSLVTKASKKAKPEQETPNLRTEKRKMRLALRKGES